MGSDNIESITERTAGGHAHECAAALAPSACSSAVIIEHHRASSLSLSQQQPGGGRRAPGLAGKQGRNRWFLRRIYGHLREARREWARTTLRGPRAAALTTVQSGHGRTASATRSHLLCSRALTEATPERVASCRTVEASMLSAPLLTKPGPLTPQKSRPILTGTAMKVSSPWTKLRIQAVRHAPRPFVAALRLGGKLGGLTSQKGSGAASDKTRTAPPLLPLPRHIRAVPSISSTFSIPFGGRRSTGTGKHGCGEPPPPRPPWTPPRCVPAPPGLASHAPPYLIASAGQEQAPFQGKEGGQEEDVSTGRPRPPSNWPGRPSAQEPALGHPWPGCRPRLWRNPCL